MFIVFFKNKGNDKRKKNKGIYLQYNISVYVFVYFVCFDFIIVVKSFFVYYIYVLFVI